MNSFMHNLPLEVARDGKGVPLACGLYAVPSSPLQKRGVNLFRASNGALDEVIRFEVPHLWLDLIQ